jgi:MFS family permease
MTAAFMAILDVSIVFVASPSIATGLGASPSQVEWVVAAYGLAFALGLITGGRLGDLLGRRRVFVAGLAVFAAPRCAASRRRPRRTSSRASCRRSAAPP